MRYLITEKIYKSDEIGEYFGYGIQNNSGTILAENITNDKQKAEAFIQALNTENVEDVHFDLVLEDFLLS